MKPVYVIAEAGINHNGSAELGLQMIDAAKQAGANAIKFQTFRADRLVSRLAAPQHHAVLASLELSAELHHTFFAYCQKVGIDFLSTPFDEESADFLKALGVTALKIASGELTVPPFLAHVGSLGLPVILSTGMATLNEVRTAVSALQASGCPRLTLLHCCSTYPADFSEANLRAISTLHHEFALPVGYSDHTPGTLASVLAVALGAQVIEKHFTLDRSLPGPDHAMSLVPEELRSLVEQIRSAELCLGHGRKEPAAREATTALAARRSLVAARPLAAGTLLSKHDLVCRRPGTGIPAEKLAQFIGRRLGRALSPGELLSFQDVVEPGVRP